MPVVAVAFCPHPPVLVPEVAQGAAPELDALRLACDAAVQSLLGADPARIVVVGGGDRSMWHPGDAAGSLSGFGVDVLAGGSGDPLLPLSLTVGSWLLDRAGYEGPRELLEVGSLPPRLTPAPGPERVGLLVMGDGSACRDERAPGHVDPRAVPFDAAVARALADGDPTALGVLAADPLASDLLVAGRAAWAVAAALLAGARPRAHLLADLAPYGVGYLVATWRSGD